jgi:hypothetical protein
MPIFPIFPIRPILPTLPHTPCTERLQPSTVKLFGDAGNAGNVEPLGSWARSTVDWSLRGARGVSFTHHVPPRNQVRLGEPTSPAGEYAIGQPRFPLMQELSGLASLAQPRSYESGYRTPRRPTVSNFSHRNVVSFASSFHSDTALG